MGPRTFLQLGSVDLTTVLRAAQDGDEWAMTQLYRTLNPPLVRYLRHRVPEAVEDVAAECWLAVSRILPGFEGGGEDLRAWLFGVARRRAADHWRTRRRGLRVVHDDANDVPSRVDVEQAVVDSMSAQSAVEALTRNLSGEQAEVVLLRVVGGLSVEQVARLLGKRPGAVRVLQHRALRRLAQRFERERVTR